MIEVGKKENKLNVVFIKSQVDISVQWSTITNRQILNGKQIPGNQIVETFDSCLKLIKFLPFIDIFDNFLKKIIHKFIHLQMRGGSGQCPTP